MRLLRFVSHRTEKAAEREGKGRERYAYSYAAAASRLGFRIVAGVAATMATDLAPPDSNEGARVAVGAAPGQDVAIGGLHNGEDMAGALVCHDQY